MGAKFGTNHESHNHNDVGNFIIYVNGSPAIIDIGVGTYTNVTFSGDRYSIFSMQSQWHNTPTINGVLQMEGNKYFASNVSHTSNEESVTFTGNISGAYPKEAEVKSWIRRIEFDNKQNSINVKDNYELKQWIEPIKVHFITILEVKKYSESSGIIEFSNGLSMQFDSKKFRPIFDEKVIDKDDTLLREVWGDVIRRVTIEEKVSEGERSGLVGELATTFRLT